MIGVPDEIRDEAVAAVVVATGPDALTAEQLTSSRRAAGEVQGPDDRPLRRRAAQDLDRKVRKDELRKAFSA